MPYALRMDGRILRVDFTGTLTNQDLSQCVAELANAEESTAVIPHRLVDFRSVERLDIDFSGVLAVAEARRRRSYRNRFKTAVVASDVVRYGFARMFQTLNDNPQIVIAIFGDEVEALSWLGRAEFKAPRVPWHPRLSGKPR